MTAPAWRTLPVERGTPAALLDGGLRAFAHLADEPVATLRWYRSTTPAVVLGRGQGALSVHDAQVDVVSRFSGGGAVWLAPDILALDVLLPAEHPWVGDRLTEIFDRVGAVWLAALRRLGVPDLSVHDGPSTARRRGSPRERLLAAVCYATAGRGEVFWRDRKLVGLAQRRRRPGAVVQCGMLRRWRPQQLLAALGADPGDPEVLRAAVGLDELCDDPPSDGAVIGAVEDAFEDAAVR